MSESELHTLSEKYDSIYFHPVRTQTHTHTDLEKKNSIFVQFYFDHDLLQHYLSFHFLCVCVGDIQGVSVGSGFRPPAR